jgi:hypothetical protein
VMTTGSVLGAGCVPGLSRPAHNEVTM